MMRYAGIHWPSNANGEHPSVDAILSMPGIREGCCLITAESARYWYRSLRATSPLVVWRAIPRVGKLPAQLGWEPNKVADECLNLWNEQPHAGSEWFLPLNELQFEKEAGAAFPGYTRMAEHLAQVRLQLRRKFTQQYPGAEVRLMFPAWVPGDDLEHADEWISEARQWEGVCLHAYGSAGEIGARYAQYRQLFGPDMPIFIGEWNANHTGTDERASLLVLEAIASSDPNFLGAAYYIWETNNDGEHDLSIWGNPDRYALFRSPPVAVQPAPEPAPEPAPPEPIQEPAMPTSDPWEHFSAEQIATASGCPLDAVTEHWPRIVRQLALCGIADRPVQVAAIGTVAIETASTFRPIHEYGTEADWADYEGGPEYAGRGFIQLTHLSNYRTFGEYVDDLWHAGGAIDLVARPDDALDPNVAAAVLATYFVHHTTLQGYSIPDAARAGDWEWVRRLVQGGDAGLSRLVRIASALEGAPMPTKVAFDANEPAHAQEESFDCSQEALEWALFAVGRRPSDDWLENTMIDEGVMSKEQGLLDATGKGLADFVTRQYGEFGFYANNEPSVTFDAVANEIGPYPLLIGGRGWGHWSGCRGYDKARDVLLLANPADGWMGVHQTMTREQWDALGPFSMVRVLHPDLVPAPQPAPPAPEPAPAPSPAPEPAPPAMTLADVRARLLAIQDEITALLANLPAA